MVDFPDSTQRKRWMFTPDSLFKERERTRQLFLDQYRATSLSPPKPTTSPIPDDVILLDTSNLITLEEESTLLRFYEKKLIGVCTNLKLPRKVLATSINFLKRFYIRQSALNTDPQAMALTCLYLACKTEDCYISAAELGRLVGMPAEIFLKLELILLQGMDFDLLVYSSFRAFEGCWIEYNEWIQDKVDESVFKTIQKCKEVGYQIINALLLSDAPLLYTPGQLGLFALKHCRQSQTLHQTEYSKNDAGPDFDQYMAHILAKSNIGDQVGRDLGQILESLTASLRKSSVGTDGVQDASPSSSSNNNNTQEEVAAIDRKLKSFKQKLLEMKKAAKKVK